MGEDDSIQITIYPAGMCREKEGRMKKQEIEKRLQKLLKELRMSNEEYYEQLASKNDYVKEYMTPSDMYAARCGSIQAEIEWILTH